MLKQLKSFTLKMMGGANVASLLVMLLIGCSDRINPADHPALANAGLLFPVLLAVNLGFIVFWVLFKPRGVIIPLVGFLVCYSPVRKYSPVNMSGSVPDSTLKVLSFNVQNFGYSADGSPGDGPNPIVSYLARSKADIICLQEANGQVIKAELDSVMGRLYSHHSEELKDSSGDMLRLYSRFPIKRVERIHYQSYGNLSVAYVLDVNGKDVLVVNNHLESNLLNPTDKAGFKNLVKGELGRHEARQESTHLIDKLAAASRKRVPQVDSVAAYVARHIGRMPVILCGDFNESPISYAHYRMENLLTDCYVSAGNGPGWSYHRSGMYVRIDNIFCSDDWKPYQCRVDDKIKESDHYPIACLLKKQLKH